MTGTKADHPHAGGEHSIIESAAVAYGGPSPRGWGARILCVTLALACRTIPTRVGSTASLRAPRWPMADHPHAGGEHKVWGPGGQRRAGPSPRGWGAPQASVTAGGGLRTIPTRVGSTVVVIALQLAKPDHPHAGGEHAPQTT